MTDEVAQIVNQPNPDWDSAFSVSTAEDIDELQRLWASRMFPTGVDNETLGFIIRGCRELGYTEEKNPLIAFVKAYINKNGSINKNEYVDVHNLYANAQIEEEDLRGNSNDGFNAIIFNKSLYSQQQYVYIVKMFYWCITGTNLKTHVVNQKVRTLFHSFKSYNDLKKFRDALIFEPGDITTTNVVDGDLNGTVKSGEKISQLINTFATRDGGNNDAQAKGERNKSFEQQVDEIATDIEKAKQIRDYLIQKYGDQLK